MFFQGCVLLYIDPRKSTGLCLKAIIRTYCFNMWTSRFVLINAQNRLTAPDSKVHVAHMWPTWGLSAGPRWVPCWPDMMDDDHIDDDHQIQMKMYLIGQLSHCLSKGIQNTRLVQLRLKHIFSMINGFTILSTLRCTMHIWNQWQYRVARCVINASLGYRYAN